MNFLKTFYSNTKVKNVLIAGNLIIGLSLITHVLNYIFTIGIGRYLSVSQFGEVATLWSILAILTVPTGAIGLLVTKYTAIGHGHHKLIKSIKSYILFLIFITLVIGFFGIYFVTRKLNIELWPYIVILITVCITYLQTIFQNIILGKENFLNFNLVSVYSTLAKLITGLLFVYLGFGVLGACVGVLIASVVGSLYSYFSVKKSYPETESSKNLKMFGTENLDQNKSLLKNDNTSNDKVSLKPDIILKTIISNFILVSLINLDVVLAKYYFTESAAGLYASMSTISKVPLYVCLAITGAMYAVYSRLHIEDKSRGARYFLLYIFFVMLITIMASMFAYLWGSSIISIFFGVKYANVGGLLYKGFIFYGIINSLYSYSQYYLAKSEFGLTKILIISMIYIIITYEFFSIII